MTGPDPRDPGAANRRQRPGTGPDTDPAVLDCRGQRCPLPVIALARAIGTVEVGAVLRVLADDPAARGDIAAWCRMRDHKLIPNPAPDTHDVRRTH